MVQLLNDGTYETGVPGAAGQMESAALANRAYKEALSRLGFSKTLPAFRRAGFTADFDPESGMVKGLGVDVNNPYGSYQQARRTHALQGMSQQWEAQERGLNAGGGLGAQMVNNMRYEWGADDSELGNNLQNLLSEHGDTLQQITYDRDRALWEAQRAAAQAAIEAQDFSPANFEGMEYPTYGEDPYRDPMADPYINAPASGPQVRPPRVTAPSRPKAKPKPKPNRNSGNPMHRGTYKPPASRGGPPPGRRPQGGSPPKATTKGKPKPTPGKRR